LKIVKHAFESARDQTAQRRHAQVGLAGAGRPDEQQPRFIELGIFAHVAADIQQHFCQAWTLDGIVGREHEIIQPGVLIERRDIGARFHAPLAPHARALASLSARNAVALDDLPA
jgi:hypothetical protein